MPERMTAVHRWPEGILRTGRAAAFLTLASGINGTMAALVPGWEPRWLYVAAVGVIAALDGWMIGVVAAVGAVICYQLMSFGGLSLAPDRDAFLLGAAVVAAIAARAMRVSIAPPRLPAPKATPLLTGITAVAVEVPADADAAAAVRRATDTLRRALDEERARAERERVMRREAEERSRISVEEIAAELQRSKISLDALQQSHKDLLLLHEGLQQRHAALQGDVERSEAGARAAAERVADYERSHEQLRSIVRDAEALRDAAEGRASQLERSTEEMRALLEQTQTLHQNSEDRAAELERTSAQLSSTLADLTVSRDAAAGRAVDAEWSRDQLLARIADVEAARKAVTQRTSDLESELAESRAASAAARQQYEDQAAALHAEMERLRASHEQQRFRLESEWNERLARNAVELTDRFNAALLESDARADAARTEARRHSERIGELEREIVALRSATAAKGAEIEAEWQQQLQSRVSEVTDIYNQAVIDAEERRDSAISESKKLAARLAELEDEHDLLRAGTDRAAALQAEAQSLAGRTAELQSENERLHAQADRAELLQEQVSSLAGRVQELESVNDQLQSRKSTNSTELEDQSRTLMARVAELEAEAEMLRRVADQQRARSEAEWSEKFTRSAMEITQRFQSELASANGRAGEAAAEATRLTQRLRELEHEQMELRSAFDREKASLEDEWNGKLQTIVAHLASDHESDLGQATLEREEARAEARRLAKKLSQIESSVHEMSSAYEELQKRDEALRLEAEEQRRNAEELKRHADSRDGEWNARLAANALELTQRFNGAMAAADSRLQQANREAENLASRVRELEQIIAGLRSSDEERRAAIDAEWSGKLQTIVNHLASDHEADIGQTLMEKEEARAELRMASSRLAALQKTVESEREAQGKSNADWMAERAQLLGIIDSFRRRLGLSTTSAGTTPLPPPPGTSPTVLVVHRDSAVRAIVKHALETSGYDVTTAADGLEAFRVATAQKPDVILAEALMPKMDGRELVQMLKSRPETAGVKIVLMNTNAENGDRSAGGFHADDFLRDPANVEALKTTLANVLGQS